MPEPISRPISTATTRQPRAVTVKPLTAARSPSAMAITTKGWASVVAASSVMATASTSRLRWSGLFKACSRCRGPRSHTVRARGSTATLPISPPASQVAHTRANSPGAGGATKAAPASALSSVGTRTPAPKSTARRAGCRRSWARTPTRASSQAASKISAQLPGTKAAADSHAWTSSACVGSLTTALASRLASPRPPSISGHCRRGSASRATVPSGLANHSVATWPGRAASSREATDASP